jgi:ABC-type uncharacterized transport system substrate-binding protein
MSLDDALNVDQPARRGMQGLMPPSLRSVFRNLLVLAGIAVGLSAARAHPHVQISVRTIVVLGEKGEIIALKHAWTFDEAFSAFSTTGLDTNKDGKLDRAELADLAKLNVESLHEYDFFSYLRAGKVKSGFGAVKDFHLDHDGKALTLHFTLPVEKSPVIAKDARLEVYDPSYFVAFDFAKEKPVSVEGGKAPCTARINLPNAATTSRLSQMSESFFQALKPDTESAEWSIPVRFDCK